MSSAALVYQAGIANVFDTSGAIRRRLMQADFAACENFARGLAAAGVLVVSRHCNEAGDIARRPWSAELDDAPFRERMQPVGEVMR